MDKHLHPVYVDKQRYMDDRDRDRLIYRNGEYYRLRESYYTGGPYTVPRVIFDPYHIWRMTRPVHHPWAFWKDLDLKYARKMYEPLDHYTTHFIKEEGGGPDTTALLTTPIGADVTIKAIPVVTIAFGDKNLNFSVEITEDKVYRIDYMEDATLKSVIGKVTGFNQYNAFDYRNKEYNYITLRVDASNEMSSNVVTIDSRNIRYILSLSDIETRMSVMETYIGPEEPNTERYRLWFNPITGENKVFYNNEWKSIDKPTEAAEEGKYWKYDDLTFTWSQEEVPPRPEDYIRNKVWSFNYDTGKWESVDIATRPSEEGFTISALGISLYGDRYISAKPITIPESSKVWGFVMDTHQWAQLFYPTAEGNYYLASDGTWIDIPNRPEEELEEGKIYTLTMEYSDEQGYHNPQWVVADKEAKPDIEIDETKYYWEFDEPKNKWFIRPLIPTYNQDSNSWEFAESNEYTYPEGEPSEGYHWEYSVYWNRYVEIPDQYNEPELNLPRTVDGEIVDGLNPRFMNNTVKIRIYDPTNTGLPVGVMIVDRSATNISRLYNGKGRFIYQRSLNEY